MRTIYGSERDTRQENFRGLWGILDADGGVGVIVRIQNVCLRKLTRSIVPWARESGRFVTRCPTVAWRARVDVEAGVAGLRRVTAAEEHCCAC